MKKIRVILLAAVMVLSFAACAEGNDNAASSGSSKAVQTNESASQTQAETAALAKTENESGKSDETQGSDPGASGTETGKILVAYFSATNNTEGVAQKLADGLGADIYEIIPEQPYTDEDLNYGSSQSRTSAEMDDPNARPAISGSVENMGQYDIVFLGYPIWWGRAPRIMSTFIESYDFSGKTIVPFCTSGSSGFGDSDSALRSAADGAEWILGHRFSAGASADDIMKWVDSLGLV